MKISIIIPVYNVEAYLERCLKSFINQGLSNLELICIDDGATDNSGYICDKYAKLYDEIKVFHKNNGGVATARNVGLEKATGDYIAWCDPDDYVDAQWKEKIFNALYNYPDAVVIGINKIINGNVITIPMKYKGRVDAKSYIYELSCDRYIKSYLCTHIIKKNIFNGLTFDNNVKYYEDYDFFSNFAIKLKNIYFCSHSLYYYEYRGNSLTNQRKPIEYIEKSVDIAKKRFAMFSLLGVQCSKAGYLKTTLISCIYFLEIDDYHLYKKYRRMIRDDINYIFDTDDMRIKDKATALLVTKTPWFILKKVYRLYRYIKKE